MLEILALGSLAFWVLLSLDRGRAWPGELRLPPGGRAPGEEAGGSVVAVVPARDEAAVLPQTLPHLLAQEALEAVIVVDDGSADGTAEVAAELARAGGDPGRLRVVRAPPAPAGWSGKVHALAAGVAAAEAAAPPEWLLFVDADVRLRPGAVGGLLAQAGRGPYDLVSVMARLHAESVWDRLLIPPFVFFFQLLYPFRRVARPASRVAAAAGGCVLLRRAALAAAGGLAAISGAVIDDVALGRAVKRAGGRPWLGLDPGIVSVRRYPGLGAIWRMVARSAFVQLRYRWTLLVAVLAGLVLLVASPPLVALAAGAAAAAGAAGGGADPALLRALLAALLAWALESAALLPAVRHHRVPARYAATLPGAAVLYALMTFSSAWGHLRGRATPWKGRRYPAPYS